MNLGKRVDLLLLEHPYFVCRQHDLQNSDQDFFSAKEVEPFRDFVEYVLMRRRHECIFSSSVQLSCWWWRFRARAEKMKDDVGETEVFVVKRTPLLYSRENSNYLRDLFCIACGTQM